jgi:hypothetical protein
VDPRLARLERLRPYRGIGADTDPSIAPVVASIARERRRLAKALGPAVEAWEAIVPAPLARACTLVTLASGTLSVETASNAVAFELDRFLRGGGQRDLTEATAGAVRAVRVRIEHGS